MCGQKLYLIIGISIDKRVHFSKVILKNFYVRVSR